MKVRIYKNQPVPENPSLFVSGETKDYGPFDLIECYSKDNPTVPIGAFQAQFIKFGGLVYREQEYLAALKELGLIDLTPETLNEMLLSDQSAIVVDKNPTENIPLDVSTSDTLSESTPSDQYSVTQDGATYGNVDESTSTTTPATSEDTVSSTMPSTDNSNTTTGEETLILNEDPLQIDVSSTTPQTVSTSTPESVPTLDLQTAATSSEPILLTPVAPDVSGSTTPATEATSTLSEIVSYAKKTIKKKVGVEVKNKLLG